MTEDELIIAGFEFTGSYEKKGWYDFLADSVFIEYLKNNYPDAFDFLSISKIQYNTSVKFAAVSIDRENNKPILYLNKDRVTHLRELCTGTKMIQFYNTLACLIVHEELHYVLRHFRVPFQGFDCELLNIAQDMVIDNIIHRRNPGWRNWEGKVGAINRRIDQTKSILPKLSLVAGDKYDLLNFKDLDIYHYMNQLAIDIESGKMQRFDTHEWTEEVLTKEKNKPKDDGEGEGKEKGEGEGKGKEKGESDGEGKDKGDSEGEGKEKGDSDGKGKEKGKSEGEGKGKDKGDSEGEGEDESSSDKEHDEKGSKPDPFEILAGRARERLGENAKRLPGGFFGGDIHVVDKVFDKVASGREHNFFNILKKFIKKMSYKQKNNTWKKTSRKQPGVKPGVIYKKTPGEVLIMVDTSGSMLQFINKRIEDTMNGIYTAFTRMAKVYGIPSKMYKADVDDMVRSFRKINKVEDLKKIQLIGGGGNNFEHIFNELVFGWKSKTKSSQKFPDFVIVITDLGDDLSFLKDPKYRSFGNKIIWIYTQTQEIGGFLYEKPAVGIVIDAFADDWSASIR